MTAFLESGTSPSSSAERPRCWAEIDLQAMRHNVRVLRMRAPNRRLLAVLKADAYGHGARSLAPVLVGEGVWGFGVGDAAEAFELRAVGIAAPIVILGAWAPSELSRVVSLGLTPVIHGRARIHDLEAEALKQRREVSVHLKVDTGMGRLGMGPSVLLEVAQRVKASPVLKLEGLMSHLADSGESKVAGMREQMHQFDRLADLLANEGMSPRLIHLRNSAGLLDDEARAPSETLARAGAAIYGFSASGAINANLKPVLSLRTQIVFLKDLPAGSKIGYGGLAIARRKTRVAILPVGYDDGIMRAMAENGEVLVRGQRAPLIGAVSMDYTTIDVTDIPGAVTGDVVTIIGEDATASLRVEEVAARAGTIPYELLCRLGRRVVRFSHEPEGDPLIEEAGA